MSQKYKRRNSDEEIRELARRIYAGETDLIPRLAIAWKRLSGKPDPLEAVLTEFVATVNQTGGVRTDSYGIQNAMLEWTIDEVGSLYMKACAALGIDPTIAAEPDVVEVYNEGNALYSERLSAAERAWVNYDFGEGSVIEAVGDWTINSPFGRIRHDLRVAHGNVWRRIFFVAREDGSGTDSQRFELRFANVSAEILDVHSTF